MQKKLLVSLAGISLLALSACGGSDSESSSNESSSAAASTSAPASESATSATPSPTPSEKKVTNIGSVDSGKDFTMRVIANGSFKVVYEDANGKTVSEQNPGTEPFEVTYKMSDETALTSVMADSASKDTTATELRCEIESDGKVIAYQTQDQNENQEWSTVYCAMSKAASY